MKLKNVCSICIVALVAVTGRADVTIEITGATAFRGASNQAILNAYNSAGALGTTYNYAHSGATAGSLNNANRATFVGIFPGVPGTTTIRTSWNGSTEGIRAVALGGTFSPSFLTPAAITGPGENFNKTTPTDVVHPKFSFSDVRQSSSPISSPVLSPSDARVGVVTFAMMANEGAPANLTGVTTQQCKALLGNGFQPLSLFTGDPADSSRLVFGTGRNDGSGTRTTYLAETGYGIARPVNQYISTVSTATAIQTIRRVPRADGANASTLWGNDVDGNGGYASSSSQRDDMGKTTALTDVLDADNSVLLDDANVLLIAWLPTNDAFNAANNGGKILAFNGVQITPTATGLSPADLAKVTNGQYTAWGYQQLYFRGALAADENTVYTAIKNGIPAALGASGVALSAMNVSRPDDGAPVAP